MQSFFKLIFVVGSLFCVLLLFLAFSLFYVGAHAIYVQVKVAYLKEGTLFLLMSMIGFTLIGVGLLFYYVKKEGRETALRDQLIRTGEPTHQREGQEAGESESL